MHVGAKSVPHVLNLTVSFIKNIQGSKELNELEHVLKQVGRP